MMMTTAVFAIMWSWAARGPDVVGADVAARSVTFNAEADDGYRGAVVATCRTYGQGAGAFAVVVFDAPQSKGIERVELRRGEGELCRAQFGGTIVVLRDKSDVERGYFLGVAGALVLMRGDDGFGAHDRLAVYSATDGAVLKETTRFADKALRIEKRAGSVALHFREALKVSCDPRSDDDSANAACLATLRADNDIAAEIKLRIPNGACGRVHPEAHVQLGTDVVVVVDDVVGGGGSRRVTRQVVGGDVVCGEEP